MPPRFASQNEDAIMSNGVRTPPPSKRPVAGRVDSPPGREELPRIYARRQSDCSSSCRLPPEPPSTGQAVRYARRLHRRCHDPIPVHSTSHSLPPAGILHPNYPPRFHRQLPCASLIPGSCAGKILCPASWHAFGRCRPTPTPHPVPPSLPQPYVSPYLRPPRRPVPLRTFRFLTLLRRRRGRLGRFPRIPVPAVPPDPTSIFDPLCPPDALPFGGPSEPTAV